MMTTPTYLESGDASRHRRDYWPEWLDDLARPTVARPGGVVHRATPCPIEAMTNRRAADSLVAVPRDRSPSFREREADELMKGFGNAHHHD